MAGYATGLIRNEPVHVVTFNHSFYIYIAINPLQSSPRRRWTTDPMCCTDKIFLMFTQRWELDEGKPHNWRRLVKNIWW